MCREFGEEYWGRFPERGASFVRSGTRKGGLGRWMARAGWVRAGHDWAWAAGKQVGDSELGMRISGLCGGGRGSGSGGPTHWGRGAAARCPCSLLVGEARVCVCVCAYVCVCVTTVYSSLSDHVIVYPDNP